MSQYQYAVLKIDIESWYLDEIDSIEELVLTGIDQYFLNLYAFSQVDQAA